MEFYRNLAVKTDENSIRQTMSLDNLEALSNLVFTIGEQEESRAEIGGLWGEFTLIRSEIRGGLRFSLLECPNALCWTVTTGFPPDREVIVVHLTINREQKDQEFIDEINEFLDDHCKCLSQLPW